jgi:hypothetical protein
VPSLVCKLDEGCPAKEFEVDLAVHLLASDKVFAPGTTYNVCPYCSTLYRHNPALAPNEARPAECELHHLG